MAFLLVQVAFTNYLVKESDGFQYQRLLVSEPKITFGLQSPKRRQIAEVTENILLVLNKCQKHLEY